MVNLTDESRSPAACPGPAVDKAESPVRGTSGSITQTRGESLCNVWLPPKCLFIPVSLQVRIVFPCHQYECLSARAEKGALQSEWRTSRWAMKFPWKNSFSGGRPEVFV